MGYALLDSPVALAAWMLDQDTDSYYKIASDFVRAALGDLTRDHIVDDVTHWLTATGARPPGRTGRGDRPRPRGGRLRPRQGAGRIHPVPR